MRKRLLKQCILVLAASPALGSCGEDDAPGVTGPSGATPIASPTGTWLRIANLSSDLNGAGLRLDGKVFRERLSYPDVTSYRHVEPGSHRIRFVPPPKGGVDPRTIELDTTFDIGPADAVTIIAAGLVETRTLRVVAIQDDLAPSGERARIRLINAMSDFPSPLGLWQNRRTALVRRVEYLEEAPYRNLDAGNYPLEVRRTGTQEAVVPVVPYGLARNATYTMFAFGTLRREDLDARLVLDASAGVATLRR
jgi:hypothetical protein